MFSIIPESPDHIEYREKLLDKVFGPGRKNRITYSFRKGIDPIQGLSFVAVVNEKFRGSIRFWPVLVNGAKKSLLLGPLAVDPEGQGKAIGIALVRKGIAKADSMGYELIVLVGDYDYYKRFGFEKADSLGLKLNGIYDPSRLLYRMSSRDLNLSITGTINRFDKINSKDF